MFGRGGIAYFEDKGVIEGHVLTGPRMEGFKWKVLTLGKKTLEGKL